MPPILANPEHCQSLKMFVHLIGKKCFLIILVCMFLTRFGSTYFHMLIGHLYFFFWELPFPVYFHLEEAMFINVIDL